MVLGRAFGVYVLLSALGRIQGQSQEEVLVYYYKGHMQEKQTADFSTTAISADFSPP